jgi:hypothetical protein
MSGYLYHSQLPPPSPEGWLRSAKFDPCKLVVAGDETGRLDWHLYASKLGDFRFGRLKMSEMITAVADMCVELRTKYASRMGPPYTFSRLLQEARDGDDVFDGIRLEAARAILAG